MAFIHLGMRDCSPKVYDTARRRTAWSVVLVQLEPLKDKVPDTVSGVGVKLLVVFPSLCTTPVPGRVTSVNVSESKAAGYSFCEVSWSNTNQSINMYQVYRSKGIPRLFFRASTTIPRRSHKAEHTQPSSLPPTPHTRAYAARCSLTPTTRYTSSM